MFLEGLTRGQVNARNLFPRAYFDWGSISEIKPYQSPLGFAYDFIVPFNVVTYLGPQSAIFSPDAGQYGIGDMVTLVTQKFWADHYPSRFTKALLLDPFASGDEGCPHPELPVDFDFLGEGDGYRTKREALRKYCDELQQYDLKIAGNASWNIIDFTVSIGDGIQSQPGEIGMLSDSAFRGNPEVRGTTCFYKFQVFEQEAIH